MSTINPTVMRGLEYAKYLYKKAGEESNLSGFNSKFSVLTFHDAIEIFLYMACMHNGVRRKKDKFYEFWNVLDLTHKIEMDRLNILRNNLKHSAIEPDETNVRICRNDVTDFFNANTHLLFGINFSDISMTRLIISSDLQKLMTEAENLIMENLYEESIIKSGEAYWMVFYIHNNWIHRKLMQRMRERKFTSRKKFNAELKEDEHFVINFLPIDKRRFHKFKEIILDFNSNGSGDSRKINPVLKEGPITAEEVSFCFNFIMDVILSIQEFE